MRKIEINEGELVLRDRVIGFLERKVTPFGTSAKVDCPKRYMGKRAYLVICEDRPERGDE
jgi:putative transposon-encoded protein